MDSMLDLFMGDPVYDEQKNVIRRDFGVKNIVAIMVVGFIGYSLMGETKPISGKRKMKGGAKTRFGWPAVADWMDANTSSTRKATLQSLDIPIVNVDTSPGPRSLGGISKGEIFLGLFGGGALFVIAGLIWVIAGKPGISKLPRLLAGPLKHLRL